MIFSRPSYLFLFFVLLSCAQAPQKRPLSQAPTPDLRGLWIQNGCSLYNFERVVKNYPGNFCIFLDDGSFVSANGNSIKRFSPSQEILWELKGHYHHQLNLTPDKKRILALSSQLVTRKGKLQRDDVFLILDLDGKILSRTDDLAILKDAGMHPLHWKVGPELVILKADSESSHFNSFYEIPANAYSTTVPWMKEGNIILNSSGLGIFILLPDLSQVLYQLQYPLTHMNFLHDVQVTPDGNFLLFNNLVESKYFERFSAIQKYDPVTKKLTMNFESTPKEMFYSAACGGVQELGDYIFFSHITAGGFIWSQSEKKMVSTIPGTKDDPRAVDPTQQLKLVDVEKFFQNSKN